MPAEITIDHGWAGGTMSYQYREDGTLWWKIPGGDERWIQQDDINELREDVMQGDDKLWRFIKLHRYKNEKTTR